MQQAPWVSPFFYTHLNWRPGLRGLRRSCKSGSWLCVFCRGRREELFRALLCVLLDRVCTLASSVFHACVCLLKGPSIPISFPCPGPIRIHAKMRPTHARKDPTVWSTHAPPCATLAAHCGPPMLFDGSKFSQWAWSEFDQAFESSLCMTAIGINMSKHSESIPPVFHSLKHAQRDA